jgi:hypothetical protein
MSLQTLLSQHALDGVHNGLRLRLDLDVNSAPHVLPVKHRLVAVQLAFESRFLKPGNHLIGSRLKPGAFKLWVNRSQLAPPHRLPDGLRDEPRRSGASCVWWKANFETGFSLEWLEG